MVVVQFDKILLIFSIQSQPNIDHNPIGRAPLKTNELLWMSGIPVFIARWMEECSSLIQVNYLRFIFTSLEDFKLIFYHFYVPTQAIISLNRE